MSDSGREVLERWKRRAEICVRCGMVSPVSAEDTLRLIAALEEALARMKACDMCSTVLFSGEATLAKLTEGQ